MYVCICHSITDKDIKQSIKQGAETIGDLKAMTGCATGCGGCLEYVEELLVKHQKNQFPEFLNLHPNSLAPA